LFIALFAPGLAGAPAPAAFPTRRSSDLRAALAALRSGRSISAVSRATGVSRAALRSWRDGTRGARTSGCPRCASVPGPPEPQARSEEHTSELQSRENLVCRLLLEKKTNR